MTSLNVAAVTSAWTANVPSFRCRGWLAALMATEEAKLWEESQFRGEPWLICFESSRSDSWVVAKLSSKAAKCARGLAAPEEANQQDGHGSPCLCIPSAGIRDVVYRFVFPVVLGVEAQKMWPKVGELELTCIPSRLSCFYCK